MGGNEKMSSVRLNAIKVKILVWRFPCFSQQISYEWDLDKILIQKKSRTRKNSLSKNSIHLLEEMLLNRKQIFLHWEEPQTAINSISSL